MKTKKGFTLIELMVVMAIIAVLSVLIIGAINIARQASRNSTRQADAKTFQTALEAYFAANKNYPGTVDAATSAYDTTSGTGRDLLTSYLTNFAAADPSGSGSNLRVQYCKKSSSTYNLYVVNEPTATPSAAACAVPASGVTDFSIK